MGSSYHIIGGRRLSGELSLAGAKNAVLPILAATIVTGRTSKIMGCPELSDVKTMLMILKELGCRVEREEDGVVVDTAPVSTYEIPEKLMREMRSSVFLMGPMLARFGRIKLGYPGGCEIGLRPIDIHLSALRQMGVRIDEVHGYLVCTADRLTGCNVHMDFPSVGATENVMLAAVGAEGETRIFNGAKEPEITDLQNYLNSCGAEVMGAGTDEIVVCGRSIGELHDTEYRVIPDRIEGGTFLAAAAMTGGELILRNAVPEHMSSIVSKLRDAGCLIRTEKCRGGSICLKAPKRLKMPERVRTLPYPGFPTDMQAQIMALMSVAKGTGILTETIFENRFKHVEDLIKMGASIRTEGRAAVVEGVSKLMGAKVYAGDLRGGAALVLAGLAAEGETVVENICHIDRGYDKFDIALRSLGAEIARMEEDDAD